VVNTLDYVEKARDLIVHILPSESHSAVADFFK
jgi:hypothetical protein